MYSRKYFIESSEVDSSLKLKLSSLFRVMQDVATKHAEELGLGKSATLDRGFFWVITRYSITMFKYPHFLDTIEVCTYPVGKNKFIFPRNFIFKNDKGEVLGQASSTWLLLNATDHKIALHAMDEYPVFEEHSDYEEPQAGKIEADGGELVDERIVRYSDTDLNGHLNNTKYIEYVLDTHDDKFYKENEIENLIINYDKEVKINEKVSLYSKKLDNIETIGGKVGDKSIFSVKLTYRKQ